MADCKPQSSNSSGAASPPSADSPVRPNEIASQLAAKDSIGIVREPMTQLTVASLSRRILNEDCVSNTPCGYALALEPKPADPLAGTSQTNQEVDVSAGLLPRVDMEEKYELVSKSHLVLASQSLNSGEAASPTATDSRMLPGEIASRLPAGRGQADSQLQSSSSIRFSRLFLFHQVAQQQCFCCPVFRLHLLLSLFLHFVHNVD